MDEKLTGRTYRRSDSILAPPTLRSLICGGRRQNGRQYIAGADKTEAEDEESDVSIVDQREVRTRVTLTGSTSPEGMEKMG